MKSINWFNLGLFVTICLSCLVLNTALAQNKKSNCSGFQDTILHKFVYTSVDKIPEPIGGFDHLSKTLSKQIKWTSAYDEYKGRIIVTFVVEKDDTIDGIRISKDIPNTNNFFSNQILKAVKQYKWKPGLCKGKPVPVLFSFPVTIDVTQ